MKIKQIRELLAFPRVEENMENKLTETEIVERMNCETSFLRSLDERGLIHSPEQSPMGPIHPQSNLDLITLAKIRLEKLRYLELDQTTCLDMVRSDVIRDVVKGHHDDGGRIRELSWREPLREDWMYLKNPNAVCSLAEAMLSLVSEDVKRIDLGDIIKAKKLLNMGLLPLFVFRDDSMHVRTTVSFDLEESEPFTSGLYRVHPSIPYFEAIFNRLSVSYEPPNRVPKFLSITQIDIGGLGTGLIEMAHIEAEGGMQTVNLGAA